MTDSPRRVDLVAHLPETKVPLDWVAQRTALEASAASIDNNDDVLQAAREIRVPAEIEGGAHELGAGPTVPGMRESAQWLMTARKDKRTRGTGPGISYVPSRPCVADVIRQRLILRKNKNSPSVVGAQR